MRKSRVDLLVSKFENIRMQEDGTIGQYHARGSDLSNESFALGERI